MGLTTRRSHLSRVMFVIGRLKVAAAALAGSWLLVIVADVVLAELARSTPPSGHSCTTPATATVTAL